MVLSVPERARVFVLDDSEDRIQSFRTWLPQMRSAKTAAEAMEILEEEPFDFVFLDHDLHWLDAADLSRQHGNGKEVARYLRIRNFAGRVVIHSRNVEAAALMKKILPQATLAPFGDFSIVMSQGAAH